MEIYLSDFLGQGLVVGLCLFLITVAILNIKNSKDKNILKGLPFLFIVMGIILYNSFQANMFFYNLTH